MKTNKIRLALIKMLGGSPKGICVSPYSSAPVFKNTNYNVVKIAACGTLFSEQGREYVESEIACNVARQMREKGVMEFSTSIENGSKVITATAYVCLKEVEK